MIPAEEVSATVLYLDLERALKEVAHRLEPQEQWLISGKLFPLRRALGLGGPRYRLAGGPVLVGLPVPPPDPEDTLSWENQMAFKKATKRDARLRFALIGPAGSGKTRTALELASRLGKKVAVIDSERGRSRAYSDLFDFDVEDELPDFSPVSYQKAIKECESLGHDVIVIDSGSHEWAGKGGVLGMVDTVSARSGNKFTAWAVGTPAHQSFIDALLQCRAHLIVTFRARTEWVLEENAQGKKVPKAVGMGAVAREGTEYEVDFAGLMDLDHNMTIVKTTNYAELEGMRFAKPGKDLADLMLKWLSENTVPPAPVPASVQPQAPTVAPAQGEEVVGAPPAVDIMADFRAAIAAAATVDALTAIGQAIAAAHKAKALSDAQRKELIGPYTERLRAVSPAQAAQAAA